MLAKMIDFIAMAFIIVGVSRITGSYLVGLLVGYGWLAFSDWGGSIGKPLLRVEVRDNSTGHECSAYASVIRNLPVIVAALPARLHQALLGIERQQYVQSYQVLFLLLTFVGLVIFIALYLAASNDHNRRHFGDRIAGTVVLARNKQGVAPPKPQIPS